MNAILFMTGWAVRSSILILSGALLLWGSRVRNTSIKLAAWTVLLIGSLALPFLSIALPELPLVIGKKAPATAIATGQPLYLAPAATRSSGGDFRILPSAAASYLPRVHWPRVNWQQAIVLLYLGVVFVLLLRVAIGLVLSLRLLRRSHTTELDSVRESDQVSAPVTVGIVRPAILLPLDWRDWDGVKLKAVLAHERSHIQRHDPAVQLLSAIHRALLWASPLSWMLDRWIVRAAEEASDDAAVASTRDRAAYAEVLLEFVARGVAPIGIGMARYGRPDKRIDRILDGAGFSRGLTRWSAAAIVLLAGPLAYVVAAASPQNEQTIHFPAPSAPIAPEMVLIVQVQTPQPHPVPPPKALPTPVPTFDAVSIKPLPPGGRGPGNPPPQCPPLRYTTGLVFGAATASELIQNAYGLSARQVSGGPSWIDSDRFCIEAKSARPAERAQLKLMLQPVLADRFKLVARHETKEMPVYIMTVDKKGLLVEIKPGDPKATEDLRSITPQELKAAGYKFRTQIDASVPAKMWLTRGTMPGFAASLSNMPSELIDRPVVDKTELQGSYYLLMEWTDDDFPGAIEQQFGLKLEPAKAPLPALAIESIQRPSEN